MAKKEDLKKKDLPETLEAEIMSEAPAGDPKISNLITILTEILDERAGKIAKEDVHEIVKGLHDEIDKIVSEKIRNAFITFSNVLGELGGKNA
jgi:hypothetical protein